MLSSNNRFWYETSKIKFIGVFILFFLTKALIIRRILFFTDGQSTNTTTRTTSSAGVGQHTAIPNTTHTTTLPQETPALNVTIVLSACLLIIIVVVIATVVVVTFRRKTLASFHRNVRLDSTLVFTYINHTSRVTNNNESGFRGRNHRLVLTV